MIPLYIFVHFHSLFQWVLARLGGSPLHHPAWYLVPSSPTYCGAAIMELAYFDYKTLNCQDCPWFWRNQNMADWYLGLDSRLMMTDKVKDRFDSCADFDVEWWACFALSSQRWILWKDISLLATHPHLFSHWPTMILSKTIPVQFFTAIDILRRHWLRLLC